MSRSNNWRINKSSIMAVEGAQALKALRKVAGASGLPSDYKVHFSSESIGAGIDLDDKEVHIGGGRLFTEAPIPPEKFDVLVGLTMHEVGHQQIQTDAVWRSLQSRIYQLPQNEKLILKEFVNVGEDIAIESRLAQNPALQDYGDALFNWASAQSRGAKEHKLMELWVEYGLLHKADKLLNLPTEMDAPMSLLAALTGWLRNDHGYDERASAYLDYWTQLKEDFMRPEPPKEPKTTQPEKDKLGDNTDGTNTTEPSEETEDWSKEWGNDSEKENEEDGEEDSEEKKAGSGGLSSGTEGEDGDEVTGDEDDDGELKAPLTEKDGDRISDDLADAIREAMENNREDITSQILDEFSKLSGKQEFSNAIIRSRESKSQLIQPNSNLCKKLSRILTIKKRLQSRTMHGEQYGHIDKRHLARVGTDKRIFSLKYKFPDGFPNTRILIDLSGSMSGTQATSVLQAAGALQMLANAEVWGYYQDGNIGNIQLIRLDEGKLVHHFDPIGSTPSGLGIVGVSLGMKKNGLVIHLTDGEHNYGQEPWNAHWVLQKRGIQLVNLIWGRVTKHYDLPGLNFRKLDGLADFPDALYEILVQQAKLGNIGG